MNLPSDSRDGYSAEVHLYLIVNGTTWLPHAVSSDFVRFDEPVAFPAGEAELIVQVDEHQRRRRVMLHAATAPSEVVNYTALP